MTPAPPMSGSIDPVKQSDIQELSGLGISDEFVEALSRVMSAR